MLSQNFTSRVTLATLFYAIIIAPIAPYILLFLPFAKLLQSCVNTLEVSLAALPSTT